MSQRLHSGVDIRRRTGRVLWFIIRLTANRSSQLEFIWLQRLYPTFRNHHRSSMLPRPVVVGPRLNDRSQRLVGSATIRLTTVTVGEARRARSHHRAMIGSYGSSVTPVLKTLRRVAVVRYLSRLLRHPARWVASCRTSDFHRPKVDQCGQPTISACRLRVLVRGMTS